MRDNSWLEQQLNDVWLRYFRDIPKLNGISIKFGRKAVRRLASIRQAKRVSKHSDTEITVTGYFQDGIVPESIVRVTLAHELVHYAHGFGSPHPQFSKYPHRGNIVDSELIKRGLNDELAFQEKWLKEEWKKIIGVKKYRRRVIRRRVRCFKPPTIKNLIKLFGF